MQLNRSDFPDGFLFGAATSAYQIEGHSYGGAGQTHWDTFAATPGKVAGGENGGIACDHYHRFEQDFDLTANAHLDAYRFSVSWARVLPSGRGALNQEGLDYYDRLIDAMLARGLKPYATLYHWELPSALADKGGWRNRDIAGWFGDFSEIISQKIGDRLAAVAPINEPWCVAWLSHFLGHHAPGLADIEAAARAMHHVLLAHGTSVQAMRACGQSNIGMVVNHEFAEPADDSLAAQQKADLYDAIYNRWFLSAARNKCYPANALEGLEPYLPVGWQDDFDTIAEPIDWIGLNYYTRKLIGDDQSGQFPGFTEGAGGLPKTQIGWEIYPEGLSHFLRRAARDYAHGLPLYVTENGLALAAAESGDAFDDPIRVDYLERHLAEVAKVIAEGVDVRGYFIWSLLDNYEWALGYEPRFGLVHVDFATQKRTPKRSLLELTEALAR